MTQRALFRIILPCLAVLGLPGLTAWGQSAESLARKGNVLYKQGNVQEATDAYRQALIRNPDNSLIKYNLGTALAKGGHAKDAQQALSEAAEAPGGARRSDSYYNMGVALGEAAQKNPEPAAAPSPVAPTPGAPAGAGPGGTVQTPSGPSPLEQKIKLLEQSLGAFRKTILSTNPKNAEALDNSRYNYETVQEMLRQARQQLKQEQQQDQNKDGKNQQNKDQQQKQDQQKQDQQKQDQDKQDQQKQDQQKQDQQKQDQQKQDQEKNGQQNGNKPQPTPQPTPKPGEQKNAQPQDQGGQAGKPDQLKPEQQDALGLLNMLENEKPDQFKQLFRFRGDTQKRLERDW